MIDSSEHPPKESRETVYPKLILPVIAALLLLTAAANGRAAPRSDFGPEAGARRGLPGGVVSAAAASDAQARSDGADPPPIDVTLPEATQRDSDRDQEDRDQEDQDQEDRERADEEQRPEQPPREESQAPAPGEEAADGDPQEESTPAGDDDQKAEDEDEDSKRAKPKKPRRIVLDTVYDDARLGNDETARVEAELGLVDDEELSSYVHSVAVRLLRHAPQRPFDWEFKIVDQSVPNAFALPGGKIYVSRGLLALVESEDELAGVIGHEITHSAERHAAARMDYAGRINPFAIGMIRAATIAAYGRDQERDADRGGQLLAAKAGYDPKGIATFLRKLDASERYHVGWSRLPNFLATHPSSPERSAIASDRAAGLSWERKDGISDDLEWGYYSVIDGMTLGDDPAGGLFEGSRFVHPELRFSIRFPQGWQTMNSQQAVGAVSPRRDARATLTVEGQGKDLEAVVDEFLENEAENFRFKVTKRRKIKLGDRPAIRIEGRLSEGGAALHAQMTFVVHDDLIYRLSMVSLSGRSSAYRGRARSFARSFRALDEAGSRSLRVTRLRIARARANETLESLSDRTGNELELVYTGLMNDAYATDRFAKGTPVKIGLAEPYLPAPRPEPEPEQPGEGPPPDSEGRWRPSETETRPLEPRETSGPTPED